MPPRTNPFCCTGPDNFGSYIKSPIKCPPAPRLKLDEPSPSLIDTGIEENQINSSMIHSWSILHLFNQIINDCLVHIESNEGLPPSSMLLLHDLPKGKLFRKYRANITKIIIRRLDHVFPSKKNKDWKKATTKSFYIQLSTSENLDLAEHAFVRIHMKPYIHRNFCTMVPEELYDEWDWHSVVTVPTMYSMLFTFLQGSKRKQALNFRLGSDVTRKIFDY